MSSGWIKLYRTRLASGVLRNHKLNAFQDWCLLKATSKSVSQIVGHQKIALLPGQFVFGRRKAAQDLNMSESSVQRCLKACQEMQFLTVQANNKFSLITIVNWDTYQAEEPVSDQQTDQQVINTRSTSDQPPDTNKKLKNSERKKHPKGKNGHAYDPHVHPPTVEQIRAYGLSIGYPNLDPEQFLAYYEAGGWMRGRTKIKDWRGCVKTWKTQAKPKRPRKLAF